MPQPVLLFLIFLAVGAVFLAANLIAGKLVRPDKPSPEKSEIYECGEPPVGSSWVQFDLRFYVVALLFVIFDVEMAFFFPWAIVFGGANRLTDDRVSIEEKAQIQHELSGKPVEALTLPEEKSS